MYDLLFVVGNLIKREQRKKKRDREKKRKKERKRLNIQIGLFISFSVRKRDGIYSRHISFDQRLYNYDRSTASLPLFAKWKRSASRAFRSR